MWQCDIIVTYVVVVVWRSTKHVGYYNIHKRSLLEEEYLVNVVFLIIFVFAIAL